MSYVHIFDNFKSFFGLHSLFKIFFIIVATSDSFKAIKNRFRYLWYITYWRKYLKSFNLRSFLNLRLQEFVKISHFFLLDCQILWPFWKNWSLPFLFSIQIWGYINVWLKSAKFLTMYNFLFSFSEWKNYQIKFVIKSPTLWKSARN